MIIAKRYVLAASLLCLAACSSSPKPSYEAERARAHAGYNELDNATGTPAPQQAYTSDYTGTGASVTYADIPRPVLMVQPNTSDKGEFAKATIEGINEYLTGKGYEVRSPEGSEDLANLIQMQGDISGNGDDMAYMAGLALGADVYIKFSGSYKNDMVAVEISAYETSTARLLGTKTGSVQDHGASRENKRYLVHSAAQKAMPALERTIHSYWAEDLKKGVQYKVVMRIGERFSEATLEDLQDQGISALRGQFMSVKVNAMTEKTIDLVVYADPKQHPDAFAVYSAIRQSMSAFAQTKKNNIVNKLIILELN
jgi:hypothetical protein